MASAHAEIERRVMAKLAEYGHKSPEDVCLTTADMVRSMELPYAG